MLFCNHSALQTLQVNGKLKIVQASKEVKEHNLIIQINISETKLPQKLDTLISFLYMDVET